jgi:hypothetical protein
VFTSRDPQEMFDISGFSPDHSGARISSGAGGLVFTPRFPKERSVQGCRVELER